VYRIEIINYYIDIVLEIIGCIPELVDNFKSLKDELAKKGNDFLVVGENSHLRLKFTKNSPYGQVGVIV
jgi:hypothetical protein